MSYHDDEEEEEFVSPDSDQEFNSAISLASLDFDTSLRVKYPGVQYKALRTIGAFIMRGLNLEECAILARINYARLLELMQIDEDVRAFITFKQTAYKASLMQTLAQSGVAGRNVKSAGYLLENQFRNEFGKKAGEASDAGNDAFRKALEFVRDNGDSERMIKTGLLPSRAADEEK